jgi:hypothetical protein
MGGSFKSKLSYRGEGDNTMQTQEEIQLEQAQAEALKRNRSSNGWQRTAKP